MKKTLLLSLLILSACSEAWRENRRAEIYADRIEDSEAVTAQEYSEMVSFYCGSIDRALDELKPYHQAHADAIAGGNTSEISRTAAVLTDKTEEISAERQQVKRLGTTLYKHITEIPDTTRQRLVGYLKGIKAKYEQF